MQYFQNARVTLSHVETRRSRKKGCQNEALVHLEATKESVTNLVKSLKQNSAVVDVTVLSEKDAGPKSE